MIKNSIMNLIGFRLKSFDYQIETIDELIKIEKFDKNEYNENKMKTDIKHGISLIEREDRPAKHQLNILFSVKAYKNNYRIDIKLEINALFIFDDDLSIKFTKEEKEEMLIVNGTAILFPYIRSVIYNITSFDTENNNIIMPVVNLSDLLNNNVETEQND